MPLDWSTAAIWEFMELVAWEAVASEDTMVEARWDESE